MEKVKRRNYLPKRSFQVRLMARIFAILLVVVSILAGSIYLVNVKSLDSAKDEIENTFAKFTSNDGNELTGLDLAFVTKHLSNELVDALYTLKRRTNYAFWGCIALSLIISVTYFLIVSHRIGGSVYHLEKTISALGQGDLSEHLQFRRDDEFQEVATVFNDMSESLSQRLGEIDNNVTAMKNTLVNNTSLGEQERSELIENINKLEAVLGKFQFTSSLQKA